MFCEAKLEVSDSQEEQKFLRLAYDYLHERGREPKSGEAEDAWNELTVFEIVKILGNRPLGEKEGNLRSYVMGRIHEDMEMLKGSSRSYGTWDEISLYVPKEDLDSKKCVALVRVKRTFSYDYIFRLASYRKEFVENNYLSEFLD